MPSESKVTMDTVDWTQQSEVTKLFPVFMQEKIRLEGQKKVSNTVDISPFTLETPFKDKCLLKSTQLFLEPFKRHCLFGGNGTGKTLLFERMADGTIPGFPLHLNVHHCKEMEHKEHAESVLDTVVHSHPMLTIIRACDAKVKELQASGKYEGNEGFAEVVRYIEHWMRTLGSEYAEENARKMLRALGFDETGMARSTNDLSGGLRMRVALAVAFFSDSDLLLLDEPTNHLDFPSVLWLENRLRGYSKSFLLVTHDRDLLCNVTTSVLLLEEQQIKYYACGFGEFEKRKAKEDAKKDKDMDKFLEQNRNPDPSTQTGRRVYDMKLWQDRYRERIVMFAGKFTFPAPTPLPVVDGFQNEDGSTTLMDLTDCRFTYSVEKNLPYIFDDPISFRVTTKTRCGIMGPNGAGKSTLLKILTKKYEPTEGKLVTHPNFVLAYFGQHSTAELVMAQTPMEFMEESFPGANVGKIRDHLKKTGVFGGAESTRMENLSYSQRSCVIFSKLTFICPHLLIMDEPTNFLDIDSVDSLINAANKFPGALLIVTHSRHFLRACAKEFLSVVPGQFLSFKDMKQAEAATYTFMQEMEAGGAIGKMDASILGAGGGTVKTKKVLDPNAPKYAVGETVEALWTDKKFYKAEVKAVVTTAPPHKYNLFYPEFNKAANVPEAGVKKYDKAAEAAAAAAAEAEKVQAAEDKRKAAEAALKLAKAKVWVVGDRCLAPSKDGRLYAAKVLQVLPFDTMIIEFDSAKGEVKTDKAKLRIYDAALETQGNPNGGNAGSKGAGNAAGDKGAGGKGGNAGGKGGGKGASRK